MNTDFVMTGSERQMHRYNQTPLRLGSMKKSWSNDSLSSYSRSKTCVCAPTTHPGSFRCKHHRHASSNLGPTPPPPAPAVADAKPQESEESTEEKAS